MNKLILTPKTFLALSLGCRTNQSEIDQISQELIQRGFSLTTNNPGLVILNTCVVTQKAEKETKQKIRELSKKYPNSFLVVLGCAVTAKKKLKIKLPKADLFISNEEKNRTLEIICKNLESFQEKKLPNIKKISKNFWTNKYISSGRKFIKIQEGCNQYCSYCITCFLRGQPKSKKEKEILEEINYWVKNGVKEIILTGINLGMWGQDLKEKPKFENLIEKILEKTEIKRLSFSSIYPEMITPEFIEKIVNNPRITQCLHLSLQSGSKEVLKRMNRQTDLENLIKNINLIKKSNPFFTFRADIIVGFPGETEEEFEETKNFIKKAGICFAHVFPFSIRKNTLAERKIKAKEWKEISHSIKKRREKEILKIISDLRKKEAQKQFGKEVECLVINKRSGFWTGTTQNNWPIKIFANNSITKGGLVLTKIVGFENDYLVGEITSLPTN